MKTIDGNYLTCAFTGKICYTEREAGIVINGCKKHVYLGNGRYGKNSHGNSGTKAIPRRKYFCKDCGYFHLTHLPMYKRESLNYSWEAVFYREYERKHKSIKLVQ